MRSFAITLLCLAGSTAFAQTFEVASIKATQPQEVGRMMVKMGGDPGRIDGAHRRVVEQSGDGRPGAGPQTHEEMPRAPPQTAPRQEPLPSQAHAEVACGRGMELAGLEPATSWVRSRRSSS